jgi:hypothetical protein
MGDGEVPSESAARGPNQVPVHSSSGIRHFIAAMGTPRGPALLILILREGLALCGLDGTG